MDGFELINNNSENLNSSNKQSSFDEFEKVVSNYQETHDAKLEAKNEAKHQIEVEKVEKLNNQRKVNNANNSYDKQHENNISIRKSQVRLLKVNASHNPADY